METYSSINAYGYHSPYQYDPHSLHWCFHCPSTTKWVSTIPLPPHPFQQPFYSTPPPPPNPTFAPVAQIEMISNSINTIQDILTEMKERNSRMDSSFSQIQSLLHELQLESMALEDAKIEKDTVEDATDNICINESALDLIDANTRPMDISELETECVEDNSRNHACNVFAEISKRNIAMEFEDSKKGDSVEIATQVFDEMPHYYSKVFSNVQSNTQIMIPSIASELSTGESETLISKIAMVRTRHIVIESLRERSAIQILSGIRLVHKQVFLQLPFDPGESITPPIQLNCMKIRSDRSYGFPFALYSGVFSSKDNFECAQVGDGALSIASIFINLEVTSESLFLDCIQELDLDIVPFNTWMEICSKFEKFGVTSSLFNEILNGAYRNSLIAENVAAQRMLFHFPFDPGLAAGLVFDSATPVLYNTLQSNLSFISLGAMSILEIGEVPRMPIVDHMFYEMFQQDCCSQDYLTVIGRASFGIHSMQLQAANDSCWLFVQVSTIEVLHALLHMVFFSIITKVHPSLIGSIGVQLHNFCNDTLSHMAGRGFVLKDEKLSDGGTFLIVVRDDNLVPLDSMHKCNLLDTGQATIIPVNFDINVLDTGQDTFPLTVGRVKFAAGLIEYLIVDYISAFATAFYGHFVVDLFLYIQGNILYVLLEETYLLHMQRRLEVARNLDNYTLLQQLNIALNLLENWTFSYPCLLTYNGKFCNPHEGNSNEGFHAYQVSKFPLGWILDNVLATQPFVHSLIISHVPKYWSVGTGHSGVSSCNLLVYGIRQVVPHLLSVTNPDFKFTHVASLSTCDQYRRVCTNFCWNSAGINLWRKGTLSIFIHGGRRTVLVGSRTQIPKKLLQIDGAMQTMLPITKNMQAKGGGIKCALGLVLALFTEGCFKVYGVALVPISRSVQKRVGYDLKLMEQHLFTFVHDLSETLVYSDRKRVSSWMRFKRLGVGVLLERLAQFFEIVVYSAQLKNYLDPIKLSSGATKYVGVKHYRIVDVNIIEKVCGAVYFIFSRIVGECSLPNTTRFKMHNYTSIEWIGAIEIRLSLDKAIGISYKILHIKLPGKSQKLALHFENQGTPIMIDGSVITYILLGVDSTDASGDCALLLLAPYYIGTSITKDLLWGFFSTERVKYPILNLEGKVLLKGGRIVMNDIDQQANVEDVGRRLSNYVWDPGKIEHVHPMKRAIYTRGNSSLGACYDVCLLFFLASLLAKSGTSLFYFLFLFGYLN